VSGSSQAVAEQLVGIGHAGFTFFNVALAGSDARERFAAEVIPVVRDELGWPVFPQRLSGP
jgi:hypothetical protein